jgi:hypothetical protein
MTDTVKNLTGVDNLPEYDVIYNTHIWAGYGLRADLL